MPFVGSQYTTDVYRRESFRQGDEEAQLQGPGQDVPRAPPRSDVVLVFPYKTRAVVRWGEAQLEEEARGLQPPTEKERHQMETWQSKRTAVLHALSDSGLVLFLYYSRDRDEIFVRVAADEAHLRQVAATKRYKLELKPQYFSAFAEYRNDYVGRRELNYSDRCVVSHLYKTHTVPAKDGQDAYPQSGAIFRTTDRIRLIDSIIGSLDHNCAGVDVGQLMHDGDLLHYFPLHENGQLASMDQDWFRCFVSGADIDMVRDYFGERIALYFLFMSHLNKWLIVPSVLGLVFFLIELVFQTPDNVASIALCIGMGGWSVFFTHFWRRKAASHSLKWGTLGMSKQLEATRPQFTGGSAINPVTGRVDRYYPWSERIKKVVMSVSVIAVAIIVLLFMILLLFLLRHVTEWHLTFQIINAVFVEVMNWGFTNVARWLTDRENHRAYSEYQNHFLAKTVIFKFVNCYFSLYYIAFMKDGHSLFSVPMHCMHGDCMADLGSQLAVFMIIRLTLQNFCELGLPWLLQYLRDWREKRSFNTSLFGSPLTVMPDLSQAERQSKKVDYDVYDDMDEMLILYGYTTLFVVACPWVPLLSLISSVLECYLDQKKLVLLFRRPFPWAAANNEPWDTAFETFGILAMVTNTAVVVFASNAFSGLTHAHKALLFLGIEHLLIFGRILVGFLFPAVPTTVKVMQMQQNVMVHRHLNLGGEEDDHETRANAMLTSQAAPPFVHDMDDEEEDG